MLMSVTLTLLEGFVVTLELFLLTLLFALPLGLVISFGSMSRCTPLRAVVKTIVWIVRGTPLMLQIMVVFYGPGLLWQVQGLDRMPAVLVAFIINYAAYFSEIYRGGIESIPRGQHEAAQVLGMTRWQTFSRVVLLQVIKRILPPMSNEIITLVKDTSLARVIAISEIVMEAQEFIRTQSILWPLFYAGVFYLVFCGLLTLLFGFLERKLSYFRA